MISDVYKGNRVISSSSGNILGNLFSSLAFFFDVEVAVFAFCLLGDGLTVVLVLAVLPFNAVVFVDTGKAIQKDIDNSMEVSTGIGVRIKTAMGMIRLDAAKTGGHSMKYMFGFGQSF